MSQAVGHELAGLLLSMRSSAAKGARPELDALRRDPLASAAAKRIITAFSEEALDKAWLFDIEIMAHTVDSPEAHGRYERAVDLIESKESDRENDLMLNQVVLGRRIQDEYPALSQFWMGPRVNTNARDHEGDLRNWPPLKQADKAQSRDLGMIAALVLEAELDAFATREFVFSVEPVVVVSNTPGLDPDENQKVAECIAGMARQFSDRKPAELLRFAEHYDLNALLAINRIETEISR